MFMKPKRSAVFAPQAHEAHHTSADYHFSEWNRNNLTSATTRDFSSSRTPVCSLSCAIPAIYTRNYLFKVLFIIGAILLFHIASAQEPSNTLRIFGDRNGSPPRIAPIGSNITLEFRYNKHEMENYKKSHSDIYFHYVIFIVTQKAHISIGQAHERITNNVEKSRLYLTVANVSVKDEGVYIPCMIIDLPKNKCTKYANTTMAQRLKVVVPPEDIIPSSNAIIDTYARPKQLKVNEGTDVEVTCRAINSRPAASIEWQFNGNLVFGESRVTNDGDSMLQNVTSVLNLNNTNRMLNGAKIQCRAIHGALQLEQKEMVQLLSINVQYKPQVKINIEPSNIIEHNDVKLHCMVDANPDSSIAYKWYRNGTLLDDEYGAQLYISRIERYLNFAVYRCEAENVVGMSFGEARIKMMYAPKFEETEKFVAAHAGDQINLHCEVDAVPSATIQWFREIKPEASNTYPQHKIEKTSNGRLLLKLRQGPLLDLPPVDLDSYGSYVCRGVSPIENFAAAEKFYHIIRPGKPRIQKSLSFAAPVGEEGRIECVVEGLPHPSNISWIHPNGTHIRRDDERFSWQNVIKPNGLRAILVVRNVNKNDLGVYNCSARNGLGFDKASVVLAEKNRFLSTAIVVVICAMIAICLLLVAMLFVCRKCRMTARRKHKTDGSVTSSSDSVDLKNGTASSQVTESTGGTGTPDNMNVPCHAYETRLHPEFSVDIKPASIRGMSNYADYTLNGTYDASEVGSKYMSSDIWHPSSTLPVQAANGRPQRYQSFTHAPASNSDYDADTFVTHAPHYHHPNHHHVSSTLQHQRNHHHNLSPSHNNNNIYATANDLNSQNGKYSIASNQNIPQQCALPNADVHTNGVGYIRNGIQPSQLGTNV